MQKDLFAKIKKKVTYADEADEIWWCGFYFLEMTPKQLDEIMNILFKRGIFKVVTGKTADGQGYKTGLLLPSGITIYEKESY